MFLRIGPLRFEEPPSLFSREALLEFSSHYFCPYRQMTVAVVGRIGEEDIIFRREEREVSWGITALKIISYSTVIFPLFVFFVVTLSSLSFSPKEGKKVLRDLIAESILHNNAESQNRALGLIASLDPAELSHQNPQDLTTFLHDAVLWNGVEIAHALILQLSPHQLSPQNQKGNTPLLLACNQSDVDDGIALCLIERLDPSQLSLQNQTGETPLLGALFYCKKEPFNALINKMPLKDLLFNNKILLQKREEWDIQWLRKRRESLIQLFYKKIQQAIFTIGLVQAETTPASHLHTLVRHRLFDHNVIGLIGQFL